MNTFARLPSQNWRNHFLLLLPGIESYASRAFRHLDVEARNNAVSDVIASTWVAFHRLCKRGKIGLAYPTVLARYGVAQYNEGRRVGTSTNTRDVTSSAAKRKHQHRVDSINVRDCDGRWKAFAIEDRSCGPAETAAFRIDFDEWLQNLSPRLRALASKMCEGQTTSELAETHSVSRSRISQLRRELETSWNEFTAAETDMEVIVAS